MKKIILIVFVISVLFLIGCNKNNNIENDNQQQEENVVNNNQENNENTSVFNAKDYEGRWILVEDENKSFEEDGGKELIIKAKDSNTIDFEYMVMQSAPANRISIIHKENIKLDDNHSGAFTWEDNWHNKGNGTIKLETGRVIINITDTQVDENAMWGIFDGEVIFNEKNNEELKWIIQFDEKLLGEAFVNAGNEIKGCDYQIKFMEENKVNIYMNDGNYVEGTYSVVEDKIECQLTNFYGEYSPIQKIDAKINFKINSESEIEIIDIPEHYTVKATTTDDQLGGWILTEETKELSFWPLTKGIKYLREEIDFHLEE